MQSINIQNDELADTPGIVILVNNYTNKVYLSQTNKLKSTLDRIYKRLEKKTFYNKELVKDYHEHKSQMLDYSYNVNSLFNCLAYEKYSYIQMGNYNPYNKHMVIERMNSYIDFTHPKSPYPVKFLVFIGPEKLRSKSPIIPVGVFDTLSEAKKFKDKHYFNIFFSVKIVDDSEMTKEYILWYNSKYGKNK